jgi:hypothetical protein
MRVGLLAPTRDERGTVDARLQPVRRTLKPLRSPAHTIRGLGPWPPAGYRMELRHGGSVMSADEAKA